MAPVAILSLSVSASTTQPERPAGVVEMVYEYEGVPPVASTCIICVPGAVFSAMLPVEADENESAASVK